MFSTSSKNRLGQDEATEVTHYSWHPSGAVIGTTENVAEGGRLLMRRATMAFGEHVYVPWDCRPPSPHPTKDQWQVTKYSGFGTEKA